MPHAIIAEGSEVVRQLVERIVSMLGWTYDSVSDGTAALEAIRRVAPDVVILDIMLGGLNGLQLLDVIRRDPILSHIRVVIMSATGGEAEARNAGCDVFLAKPFSVQDTLQILSLLPPEQPSTN